MHFFGEALNKHEGAHVAHCSAGILEIINLMLDLGEQLLPGLLGFFQQERHAKRASQTMP